MIIPVIFSLLPSNDGLLYTWVFYKGIEMVRGKGWPIFAQSQYFNEREKQKNIGLLTKDVSFLNDFENISDVEFSRINQETFPQNIVEDYVSGFPSKTDAYLGSMKDSWDAMADYMIRKIQYHEKVIGEKTEALMCLGAPRFVKDVANSLGIKLINYEWGPLRLPSYRRTAYFDFKGSMCDGEMLERYNEFKNIKDKLPIFHRKEILAFFLNDISKLLEPDIVPQYKIGLALGYNTTTAYTILNQITMTEVLNEVHHFFGDSQIAVRYHPGDPIHGRLTGPQCINSDISLIDFIRNCERIVCITSNVAYESMLWNRPAYDVGATMYGIVANHRMEGLQDKMPSEDFLNFIAFSYLIPFEMLKNVEYIRWRLTRPKEEDIYLYHLKYYMKCLGIPEEILSCPCEERLNQIIHYRGQDVPVDINEKCEINDHTQLYATNQRLMMQIRKMQEKIVEVNEQNIFWGKQNAELSNRNKELSRQNVELCKQNSELINHNAELSKENSIILNQANIQAKENENLKRTISWRITKPLRSLGRIMRA